MPIKQKQVILRLDPSYKKCPSCGEVNVLRRSRTKNIFENLLRLTKIYKMYRCRKCNWRGALSTVIITTQSFKNLSVYVIILFFIWYIISKVVGEMYK